VNVGVVVAMVGDVDVSLVMERNLRILQRQPHIRTSYE
jgi:hypothetical protein